jgi:hypothetical protein
MREKKLKKQPIFSERTFQTAILETKKSEFIRLSTFFTKTQANPLFFNFSPELATKPLLYVPNFDAFILFS